MKIATITNQSWDLTNHYGYLVASSNNYLAYVLEGIVTMTIVTIIIIFVLFVRWIRKVGLKRIYRIFVFEFDSEFILKK